MEIDPNLRPLDLAFFAAKKRQSPRTGFIHFFYGNNLASDTIPFYENICFAIALLHQKKAECVLEAKDLFQRLIAFQTSEGNFPVYLHDYPRCFSLILGLKVLPLLLKVSASSLIGGDYKEKIDKSIESVFLFYEAQRALRPLAPLWEYRFQMCRAVWTRIEYPIDLIDSSHFSAGDWWEYWVTKQFEEIPKCNFYHKGLELCLGPFLFDRLQNGFLPSLTLIEWAAILSSSAQSLKDGLLNVTETIPEVLARSRDQLMNEFSAIHDHPMHIGLAALDSLQLITPLKSCGSQRIGPSHVLLSQPETGNWNLLWKDTHIHSLSLEVLGANVSSIEGAIQTLRIELPEVFELNRDDLFEIAFYIDATPDVNICIGELKGTSFYLGDWIQINSSNDRCLSLLFELEEGDGDFCGHVYRSNRANQLLTTRGEAYDWKIGLRTLRRSQKCVIKVQIRFNRFEDIV